MGCWDVLGGGCTGMGSARGSSLSVLAMGGFDVFGSVCLRRIMSILMI